MKQDILFLGGIFPIEEEEKIIESSKGFIQTAANNFQWNIIRGLDYHNVKPIKIINTMFVGDFPNGYKKLFLKTKYFQHCSDADDINVGFLNLWGIKSILKYLNMKPYIKKWVKADISQTKIAIAYAMTNTSLYALKYIKNNNKNIHTCIIVPDLPQFMNTSDKRSNLYNFFKNIEIKSIKKNMKYIDSYVLLTKHMANYLNINKNYTVVEGISGSFNQIKNIIKLKSIVYAGTLHKKYGILNLIKAFMLIKDDNIQLDICGAGDSEDEILKYAKEDIRIRFHGKLPSTKVRNIINSASILVNPRQNIEEFTKYSFPSKNLEYLSTGIPFIAYKLDGIPDEYDDYIYYVKGNSIEDLKNKIIDVLNKSDKFIQQKKEKTIKWIEENKNYIKQTKKIFDLINNSLGDNL